MSARRLYLHVGCRKTGTSLVQAAITASVPALAAQGLGVPLGGRGKHLSLILDPLLEVPETGEVPEETRRQLGRLGRVLSKTSGDRLLLTLEDLAQLPLHQTRVLREALADYEVHLVVSARHWGRQIPSEWQQCVKERLRTPFPDYVRTLEEGVDEADIFFRRQDVVDVIRRWGEGLPPEQVHVVAVPSGKNRFRIFKLFGDVLEINPRSLTIPRAAGNASLGHEQAEMLRRVNVALGDQLTDVRNEYAPVVRVFLTNRVLRKQSGTAIRVPPAHLPWCRAKAEAMVEELKREGYQVHGSLRDLVPPVEEEPEPFEEPSEEAVAATAVRALADVAVARHAEEEERRRLEEESAAPPTTRRVRRAAGRARRLARRYRGLAGAAWRRRSSRSNSASQRSTTGPI